MKRAESQSTDCSFREPGFRNQHPHDLTPVLGNLMLSADLHQHCTHVVHKDTSKTPPHIKQKRMKSLNITK